MSNRQPKPARTTFRCAIYTRKSTEEGLDQEFNSLDAQREAAEAFIKSQAAEGWTCLPDRYDDGGFTGGNMERPALRRLLADIEAGRIDCVVVYKVDRLSRSLLDFARMMETFDKHRASFVAFTQQINTTTPMGRLMLNVLMSFAQFEREIISERTRDKIAAARRRGKWSGGMPLLGYDVSATGSKLIVNDDEALRVRAIFELYLDHQAIMPVVHELDRRGWLTKRWITRKGPERGGGPFTKTAVHRLLTNPTYTGRVKYKSEVHQGEHAAIIDEAIWQRAQSLLQRNGKTGGAMVRNKFGALLKGILRCRACDCAMPPSHTTRNGTKRYRYYVCSNAQKRGWKNCPTKSVPAAEIERFVVEQIKSIGKDPALLRATLTQAQRQGRDRLHDLSAEQAGLDRDLGRWNAEVARLAGQMAPGETNTPAVARLADLQERIRGAERRSSELRMEILGLGRDLVNEDEVQRGLAGFTPVWEALAPREQVRVVQLLVERVDYDGAKGKVAITFHPTGIKSLLAEQEKS